jgi:hypothetical protein
MPRERFHVTFTNLVPRDRLGLNGRPSIGDRLGFWTGKTRARLWPEVNPNVMARSSAATSVGSSREVRSVAG